VGKNSEGPAKSRKNGIAIVALLLTAAIWGSGFSISKHALETLPPLYLIAFRYALAFAVMVLVTHRRWTGVKFKDLKGGVLAGTLLFAGALFLTFGLKFTTPGKQAFLCGSYVVMLPFLTWALDRIRPKRKVFFGAALCFFGIGLLSVNAQFRMESGDLLTLLAALTLAVHIITVGHFVKRQDAGVMTTVQLGTVAVLGMAVAMASGPVPMHLRSSDVGAVVYLAVFATCIAMFTQTYCQRFIKPAAVSVILSTETVFGSLFAVLLMGEVFTAKMVVGCIAIFVAMLISET